MQSQIKIACCVVLIVGGAATTAAAAGEDHEFRRHAPGIFIGNADERGGGDDYTLGIEYEYRFNRNWGVGMVYEHTPGGHDNDGTTLALANGYYHPYKGWRVGLGGGREKVHGSHGYYSWVYRAGAAYDFHVGNFGVAPSVSYDVIESHDNVLVYGIALTYPF